MSGFRVGDRVRVTRAGPRQQCVYPGRETGTVDHVLIDGRCDVAIDEFAMVIYEADQLERLPLSQEPAVG